MTKIKLLFISFCLLLVGCNGTTYHRCRFESVGDMFVCVDNQFRIGYDSFTGEELETGASVPTKRVILDSYGCCVAQLPYPMNLVEQRRNGVTICYDKNNKIEVPMFYCNNQ